MAERDMSGGKRAYEERRAAKAGKSLDKWMAEKERVARQARKAEETRRPAAAPARKPGLIGRLLDRARRPI